ncbi:MAG: cation:dicarboxylate symporter family transporter, partial [Blastocatellia bacterium]
MFENEQSLVAHVAALPPSRHKLKVHARLAARDDISPELRQALNELIERTQRAGQAPASPSPELPAPELPAPELPAPEVNEPEIVDRESPEPETPLPEQSMAAPVPAKQRATKEMAGSLIGLIGGFALGLMAYRWPHPALTTAVSVVEPLGELWTNALRMTIIPLIVSQLICGLTARSDARAVGKLGGLSLLVFILLLTLGAIFAGIVAPPLVALYNPDPATLAQLRASAA